MGRARWIVGGLSAFALVVLSSAVALAAVQRASLTVQAAPAGTAVTLHVESTARIAGTQAGPLVVVPMLALDAAAPSLTCEAAAGSVVVGEMAWRTGEVTFGASTYDGFIGEATFTVPRVAPGAYYLAEPIDARGTGCHGLAEFTVTTGQLPDTAVPPSSGLGGIAGLCVSHFLGL